MENKNVWILLIGEFVAGIGLWLGIIGNLEFLQAKVPSDFLKSVILGVGLLAGIVVGPMAGRMTDQLSKKKVMLVSGFVRSMSVLFMLVAIQQDSVWWMLAFLITIQVSAAFYFPALQAAIPLVVKEKELLQMNGVHMNVSTLSRVIGTAIAGIFLVIMSLSQLYILSLLAYLGLFLLTFLLKIDEEIVEKRLRKNEKRAGLKKSSPLLKADRLFL